MDNNMKIADRIMATLSEHSGVLCDDCIAASLNLTQRQIANSYCRKLFQQSKIARYERICSGCHKIKLANSVNHGGNVSTRQISKNKPSSAMKAKVLTCKPRESLSFKTKFNFKWIPVLKEENIYYRYPDKITAAMRITYNKAAIYRWVPFKVEIGDSRLMYIGETDLLIRRLNNYLHPGPSQHTNIRLYNLFNELIGSGHSIQLELLEFEPFKMDEVEIFQAGLHAKIVRRFIEHMPATYYMKSGYELINA